MKVVARGSPSPDMTMQQCTDETTDKDMSDCDVADEPRRCARSRMIQKTATGYVTDPICGISGVTIASHAEITGDFNSALYREVDRRAASGETPPAVAPRRSRRSGSARLQGAIRNPATS